MKTFDPHYWSSETWHLISFVGGTFAGFLVGRLVARIQQHYEDTRFDEPVEEFLKEAGEKVVTVNTIEEAMNYGTDQGSQGQSSPQETNGQAPATSEPSEAAGVAERRKDGQGADTPAGGRCCTAGDPAQ
jgi:hypothetical protein